MSRILAALAIAAALPAFAEEPVEVTISPVTQTVAAGKKPVFHVMVRALAPTRVADVARRDDLRNKLLRPRLFSDDRSFTMDDIPLEPKTLGPIGDDDYVQVKPGEAYVFDTEGEPLRMETLPPGTYGVVLRYRREFSAPQVNSNRVTLTVSR